MEKRVLNDFLVSRGVSRSFNKSESGFETPDNDTKFKYVEIVSSCDEETVKKGEVALISVNSGELHIVDEVPYLIIRMRDIIYID